MSFLIFYLYCFPSVSYRDLDGLEGLVFFFWYTRETRFKVSYANALAKSTAILTIRDNTLGSWSHLEHLLTAGFPQSKQESQSMSVANI